MSTLLDMKFNPIALLVFLAAAGSRAETTQTLDWKTVENIPPNTRIIVKTQQTRICDFERANEEKLFCHVQAGDSHPKQKRDSELVLDRSDIRQVRIAPYDDSKGFLALILAAGGGGGVDSTGKPVSFAGVKVGGPFAVDLQYDRAQGKNGFSIEGSPVIPLFRVPRFYGGTGKFVKLYGEPGIGFRAGDGWFGPYASGKVMAALLSDAWPDHGWGYPYVEYQRRFPFSSPLEGDNRITVGMMVSLCAHCGFN